jgi:hypothetical protein
MKNPNIVVNQISVEFVNWLNACNTLLKDYMATNYPNNPKEHLEAVQGGRYIKVVRCNESGQKGAAWAFIDRSNGDVLKPASWAAPAKHARGNIFDEQKGMGQIGPYGPAYIRG